ncbi:MAG: PKD domain-containing protein [Ferruginibacter sp.]|nr:PKD domain-containing protein [Ferruginibacter sp.]
MKNIFTPLLLAFTLFGFTSKAQNVPVCNAAFNFAFLNNNTVKYTPAVTGDSPFVYHEWVFGDASPASHFITPTHTYTAPGTYIVKHYLKKINSNGGFVCADSIIKQIVIQQACNLTAYFAWHVDSSNYSKIHFTNGSALLSPTDSVRWTFGDGTSSLDLNPTHTYTNSGTYTACLRVKKNSNAAGTEPCVREICKTIMVNQPCNLTANFSWHKDSSNYLKQHFTIGSIPLSTADSVRWTFGDGTSSLDLNPTHTYANAGTYTACLRVKKNSNAAGTEPCVREICKTIMVTLPCNLEAYFNWSKMPGHPSTISFENLSTHLSATDSVRWTFGDGTSSLDINVKHTYSHAGIYKVCLRVKKNGNTSGTTACVREICKEVVILPAGNCDSIHVNYTYQRDPLIPNKIYFNASANFSILDQSWTMTRLSAAIPSTVSLHQSNPAYVFQDTGYYRVCLRATGPGGCVKEFCNTIRIERLAQVCELQAFPNPAHNQVNVNVHLLQPEMIHALVYNAMNVLVKEKNQQGNAGNNTVAININDLLPGLYTIKLIYGNKTCYARFTKL